VAIVSVGPDRSQTIRRWGFGLFCLCKSEKLLKINHNCAELNSKINDIKRI
jgi:hypothetical protein